MKEKRPRLGRGLDALFGDGQRPDTLSASPDAIRTLPIERLQRGRYQPRTHMEPEALNALADSIRAQGIVQPILVREVTGGFEIIAGERRWRAAQIAGLAEVPVIVRDIPDQAAMAVALIENIQREDLNPLEEAAGLKRLQEEFGLTHDEIAAHVGRSRAAVTNLLRLLGLAPEVRELLETGRLEMGHGRALLGIADARAQAALAREVAAQGLSVRETERRVQRHGRPTPPKAAPDPDVETLERRLTETLGARVRIQARRAGAGRITIDYHSMDELEGLLGRFS
ncbi:chromosome partitioning protein ParB [Acidiferrobacter sp. SPIII_3]|jgi:ParB family chromosome partitioning protein|uniref:ParB/RepB/Spo0J family partition protein n=1 Tax=Acidiferrobacter sp. SPIII_3 TaxID=1281578 RepID=UPI000D732891|nr:ParB/RepB/Spo0J family partition protein [Acidiferrobacter sp. SPIII_3]AWP24813.1 chromosome partitioning protein ParB [Acidiferrobacter sp. SPIII_3]